MLRNESEMTFPTVRIHNANALILISFIFILSTLGCGSAPKMERPVTIWNGAPEKAAICKMTPDQIQKRSGYSKDMIAKVFTNNGEIECISCDDPKFEKFGGMTFEDIGVWQRYVETLIYKCEKWKP